MSRISPSRERRQADSGNWLKYYAGRPVIERIERVSKPGLRIYKALEGYSPRHERPWCGDRVHAQGCDDRPQGARQQHGGEVLCIVA
jgi:small subunit ribosomal protein S8